MPKLNVLDLFSGIGGFSLGLERATLEGAYIDGFTTTAFCEIEAFPRKVLAKHWPDVPCYDDVRTLTAERLAADGIAVDVICGGFPCQDLSSAGRRAGIGEGTRSGLYAEVLRLACDLRPRFIILENVAGLLSGPSEQPGQWFGRVLGDLASIGYDAEWENIPAAALGAPHRRERVWIVAYPSQVDDAKLECFHGSRQDRQPCEYGAVLADAERRAWETFNQGRILAKPHCEGSAGGLADGSVFGNRQWDIEPDVGRVADGVPNRAQRLAALGNAVVPQIPELIGRAILAALQDSRTARPSRACAAGEAFDPRVSPNPLQNVSHDAPYTGDRA
jgi:DNA (cytosine-5)-methyltransferase 1